MENTRKINVPKKYKRYYCTICNIYTNSDNQLNQHLEGIGHQQKKQFCLKSSTIDIEDNKYDPYVYIPALLIICVTAYIFCYVLGELTY